MKIYIMTDLEGVAGVLNFDDWCTPESRYYETAKELLTKEVNAAVNGFFEGGADEIVVADGHGHGGINPVLLDSRVMLMRGWPELYPFGLDESFDATAWIGQHAKSGTEFAHIAHTGSFSVLDYSINGVSIGEFGQIALCGMELGVRPIFGSGDRAFTEEAKALFPGIETVAVKHGRTPGTGDECTAEEYGKRNLAAVHFSPEKAREMIYEGALRSVGLLDRESLVSPDLKPLYEVVTSIRARDGQPARSSTFTHPSSISGALNASHGIKPDFGAKP